MSNKYKITENGVIKCACGGIVELKSTNKNMKIAGVKPMHIEDILGAPISGCPTNKFPCTKVVSINSSGTIKKEFGSDNKTFLYRVDGFTTDKGKSLVLSDAGQSVVMGSGTVSPENEKSNFEKKLKDKEEILKEYNCEYRLYLLRESSSFKYEKSESTNPTIVYKPVRASRNFTNDEDTFILLDGGTQKIKYDSVYSQILSYVYVVKDDKIYDSYQLFSRGAINDYALKDVRYINLKNDEATRYIPLDGDGIYDIYYSYIRLSNKDDITKLPKLEINTKDLSANPETTYIEDLEESNLKSLPIAQKDFPNVAIPTHSEEGNKNVEVEKKNHYNIVGVVKDKIGEIDDLYEEYYVNHKIIHSQNKGEIEKIKNENQYIYTIANTIDFFYVSDERKKIYDEGIKSLQDTFKKLADTLLTTKKFTEYLIEKSSAVGEGVLSDISNCLSEQEEIVLAYFNEVIYRKKDFFETIYDYVNLSDWGASPLVVAKNYFMIGKYSYKGSFTSENNSGNYINFWNSVKYKKHNTPPEVLALLVFSIFFVPDKEVQGVIEESGKKADIEELKFKFLNQLSKIEPLPQISKNDREDIKNLIKKQTTYKNLFDNKTNKFMEEFEQLDYVLNLFAFNKEQKTIEKTKSLYIPKEIKLKGCDVTKPQTILEIIAKKLKDTKLTTGLLDIYKGYEDVDEFEYITTAMNISLILHNVRVHLDEELNMSSFFLEGHETSLNFVKDTIGRRVSLDEETRTDLIENYRVYSVFNDMVSKIVAHEYLVEKDRKSMLSKISSSISKVLRRGIDAPDAKDEKVEQNTLTNFLYITQETPEEQKFYTKDFSTEEDNLYKFFSSLNDYNLKLNNSVNSIAKLSEDNNHNTNNNSNKLEQEGQKGQKVSIAKLSKDYYNNSTQTLSIIMSIINLKRLLNGDNPPNIKNIVGAVNDMANITFITTSALNSTAVQGTSNVVLKDILNKNKDRINKINKTSFALSTRLVVPIVILTGIQDAFKHYKAGNMEATIFVAGKTIIYALMLVPTLFGMAALPIYIIIVVLEILWINFYESVLRFRVKEPDTKLEKYIKSSLLFLSKNNSNLYNVDFLKQISSSDDTTVANGIKEGFGSFNGLRDFIGSNYQANQALFDTALLNELSSFKSALYGISLELVRNGIPSYFTPELIDEKNRRIRKSIKRVNFIKIPHTLVDDEKFRLFYSFDDGEYIEFIREKVQDKKNMIFDFFSKEVKFPNLEEFINKNYSVKKASILVLSSFIELKYQLKIIYYGEVNGTDIPIEATVELKEFNQVGFSEKDSDFIKQNSKE